jgi:hypothetical protein
VEQYQRDCGCVLPAWLCRRFVGNAAVTLQQPQQQCPGPTLAGDCALCLGVLETASAVSCLCVASVEQAASSFGSHCVVQSAGLVSVLPDVIVWR